MEKQEGGAVGEIRFHLKWNWKLGQVVADNLNIGKL